MDRQGIIRSDHAAFWLKENDPRYRVHSKLPDLVDADGPGPVVYFVQAGESGPIKIGLSSWRSLWNRIVNLRNSNPEKLHLRRVVQGDRALEYALHGYFDHLRLRTDGEWFRCDEELAALIVGAFVPQKQPAGPYRWVEQT